MTRIRTLRRRIAAAMVAWTAAVCLLYGALAFVFAYVVEDEFFAALLASEAAPQLPFVQLHRTWESVPAEVRARATPRAREVAGADGRHYHLRRVREGWLVAEVSPLLVVRPMRTTLLTILVPATLLLLLGSSVVAALVARRSVRQLTTLVEAVQRGDPQLPRDAATDHEVRVLADALEAALARVHALLRREQSFTGDVSHELRTPLAVISGAAELLERRALDPTARAQLQRIREAARSGEEIVTLLLALAREETASEERVAVPLLALVERVVVRQSADADVHVDVDPRARIVAPAAAAEVVIANLISNALRHGGGRVEIAGDGTSLTIRDRGPGLAARGRRGIGLGLVQRLCDLCGFALTLQSSEAGTEARVVFGG